LSNAPRATLILLLMVSTDAVGSFRDACSSSESRSSNALFFPSPAAERDGKKKQKTKRIGTCSSRRRSCCSPAASLLRGSVSAAPAARLPAAASQWRRTPKKLGVARGCGAQAGDPPGGPGGYRGRRRWRGDAARRDMASAIPRHTRPSATAASFLRPAASRRCSSLGQCPEVGGLFLPGRREHAGELARYSRRSSSERTEMGESSALELRRRRQWQPKSASSAGHFRCRPRRRPSSWPRRGGAMRQRRRARGAAVLSPDAGPRRRLAPSSSPPCTTTVVPSCSSPSQRGVFGRPPMTARWRREGRRWRAGFGRGAGV